MSGCIRRMRGEGADRGGLISSSGSCRPPQTYLIENLMTWFRVPKKSSDGDRLSWRPLSFLFGTERTARLGYLRYPLVGLVKEALASLCTGRNAAHQTRVLRTGVCPAPVPPRAGFVLKDASKWNGCTWASWLRAHTPSSRWR
jgi:hypothetical protein